MIVSSIYNQGIAQHTQDVLFNNLPVVGVVDCHSGIDVRGEIIRDIVLSTYPMSLLKANEEILEHQRSIAIGHRAGAVFALAQIRDESVSIIQGGDSIAVWQLNSGKICFTPDLYRKFDLLAIENFARLMKIYDGKREKVWLEHRKFLADIREKHANIDYASLNGDERIENCWFKTEIPIEELKTMLFFTDGLVAGVPNYDIETLLSVLIEMSKKYGLEAIVDLARSHQKGALKDTHIQFPEISVVSVKF